VEKCLTTFKKLGLDALVAMGGEDTLGVATRFHAEKKLPVVGVPKTMDNDLSATDFTFGFDTAVTLAMEAAERLTDTGRSHRRVMVLEVMGRDAGHIALTAGIAVGADIILLPEVPYSLENVVNKIRDIKKSGRNFALVVVSEAVKTPDGEKIEMEFHDGAKRYGGIGHYMGDKIAEATGFETRVTVLGHVQRGSSPTYNDRLLASAFGVRAVDLIKEGKFGRMVAWSNRQVIDVSIADAIAAYQQVDLESTLVHTARALGISLGD